jgi:hypothetical protein
VFLPRNLPHVFRSVGGPATALLIVTPGGLDEYFPPCDVPVEIAAFSSRPGLRSNPAVTGPSGH